MLDHPDQLERAVFRSYWDDGLLDFFAAAGVFLIGVFWLRDLPVGAAIVPALMVPVWKPAREKLIEPRLGMVEFTERRERHNRRSLRWVMYLGIATLVLGVELYFARGSLTALPSVAFISALPSVLLGLLAVGAAMLTGAYRFLVYTLVLVTVAIIGVALEWRPGMMLMTAGIILLIIASSLLAKFFHQNPPGLDPGA